MDSVETPHINVRNIIDFFNTLDTQKTVTKAPIRRKSEGHKNLRPLNTNLSDIEQQLDVLLQDLLDYDKYEQKQHQHLQTSIFNVLVQLVHCADNTDGKEHLTQQAHNMLKQLNQRLPTMDSNRQKIANWEFKKKQTELLGAVSSDLNAQQMRSLQLKNHSLSEQLPQIDTQNNESNKLSVRDLTKLFENNNSDMSNCNFAVSDINLSQIRRRKAQQGYFSLRHSKSTTTLNNCISHDLD